MVELRAVELRHSEFNYLMSRVVVSHFAIHLFSFTFTCDLSCIKNKKKAIYNVFCVTRGLLWSSGKLCTELYSGHQQNTFSAAGSVGSVESCGEL